jgi:hypothetical protein
VPSIFSSPPERLYRVEYKSAAKSLQTYYKAGMNRAFGA